MISSEWVLGPSQMPQTEYLEWIELNQPVVPAKIFDRPSFPAG